MINLDIVLIFLKNAIVMIIVNMKTHLIMLSVIMIIWLIARAY